MQSIYHQAALHRPGCFVQQFVQQPCLSLKQVPIYLCDQGFVDARLSSTAINSPSYKEKKSTRKLMVGCSLSVVAWVDFVFQGWSAN